MDNIFYLVVFVILILIIAFVIKNNEQIKNDTFKKRSIKFLNTKKENDFVFTNTIYFLENEIKLRYGKNKKEKDYQDDLFQAFGILRERHGYEIKYEAKNGRHRVDFSVSDTIGIELKVHRCGSQVKKELFNQITDYANYYPKMIGIVVNVNDKDTPDEIRSDLYSKLKQQNVITEINYYIVVLNIK